MRSDRYIFCTWHDSSRDDVIKWKYFPRYWSFLRWIHRSLVNSPHKGKWRGALMFSLFCVWINGWVNNREAGDWRRYCAHYDVTVMVMSWAFFFLAINLIWIKAKRSFLRIWIVHWRFLIRDSNWIENKSLNSMWYQYHNIVKCFYTCDDFTYIVLWAEFHDDPSIRIWIRAIRYFPRL